MVVLPDVLAPELSVVFCGTAAGRASARVGAYYAGPGNRFWDILFSLDITPDRLRPDEFHRVLEYGIGLTDIAKTASGSDAEIPRGVYDVAGFVEKMQFYMPRAIAFNGKNAAKTYLGRSSVDYGQQPETLAGAVLFVLPSTSGAARGWWDEECWRDVAEFIRQSEND